MLYSIEVGNPNQIEQIIRTNKKIFKGMHLPEFIDKDLYQETFDKTLLNLSILGTLREQDRLYTRSPGMSGVLDVSGPSKLSFVHRCFYRESRSQNIEDVRTLLGSMSFRVAVHTIAAPALDDTPEQILALCVTLGFSPIALTLCLRRLPGH